MGKRLGHPCPNANSLDTVAWPNETRINAAKAQLITSLTFHFATRVHWKYVDANALRPLATTIIGALEIWPANGTTTNRNRGASELVDANALRPIATTMIGAFEIWPAHGSTTNRNHIQQALRNVHDSVRDL